MRQSKISSPTYWKALYVIPAVFFGLGTWQFLRHQSRHSRLEEHQKNMQQIRAFSRQEQNASPGLEEIIVSEGCILVGPKPGLQDKNRSFGYSLIKHARLKDGPDCLIQLGWIPIKLVSQEPQVLVELDREATEWIRTRQLDLIPNNVEETQGIGQEKNPTSFSKWHQSIPVALLRYHNVSDILDIYQVPKTRRPPISLKNTRPMTSLLSPSMDTSSQYKVPHLQYMTTWYVLSFITSAMLYFRNK